MTLDPSFRLPWHQFHSPSESLFEICDAEGDVIATLAYRPGQERRVRDQVNLILRAVHLMLDRGEVA